MAASESVLTGFWFVRRAVGIDRSLSGVAAGLVIPDRKAFTFCHGRCSSVAAATSGRTVSGSPMSPADRSLPTKTRQQLHRQKVFSAADVRRSCGDRL